MVRYLLSALIIIHGLIHFLGFANAFKLNNVASIADNIPRPAGVVWLIAVLLFVVSGLRVFAHKDWWIVGFISVSVSQVLIISAWNSASWGTLANTIIVCAALSNLANCHFRHTARTMAGELLQVKYTNPDLINPGELGRLPEPVIKWLSHSGMLNHDRIHSVRLKQQGRLRMRETADWMDMNAEQYFNTDEPSFLWLANIKYGIIHIAGRDMYYHGKGNMVIKAASAISVADAKGMETDQGTMLRYLAEIQWFPSAALSQYITWHAIDSLTVEAEMTYKGRNVKGIFHFNANGDITAFEAKRYMEHKGSYSLETWCVPVTSYHVFNGIKVPSKGAAIWKLKAGDFNWFNWEITSIDYNCPEPYNK